MTPVQQPQPHTGELKRSFQKDLIKSRRSCLKQRWLIPLCLLSCCCLSLPPLLLLGSGSRSPLRKRRSQEGSHPARWHREQAAGTRQDRQVGFTQSGDCPRFSHRSDPVRSLSPRGITQQGQIGAVATVSWLSYSNLPHLLPLHTRRLVAAGRTLRKRIRLPSTSPRHRLAGLYSCPTGDNPPACCNKGTYILRGGWATSS